MASSKFRVEVRLNGTAIPELTFKVTHETGAKVRIPISGHTIRKLSHGDKLELYLIPEKGETPSSGGEAPKAKKYKISVERASLVVKKEAWF